MSFSVGGLRSSSTGAAAGLGSGRASPSLVRSSSSSSASHGQDEQPQQENVGGHGAASEAQAHVQMPTPDDTPAGAARHDEDDERQQPVDSAPMATSPSLRQWQSLHEERVHDSQAQSVLPLLVRAATPLLPEETAHLKRVVRTAPLLALHAEHAGRLQHEAGGQVQRLQAHSRRLAEQIDEAHIERRRIREKYQARMLHLEANRRRIEQLRQTRQAGSSSVSQLQQVIREGEERASLSSSIRQKLLVREAQQRVNLLSVQLQREWSRQPEKYTQAVQARTAQKKASLAQLRTELQRIIHLQGMIKAVEQQCADQQKAIDQSKAIVRQCAEDEPRRRAILADALRHLFEVVVPEIQARISAASDPHQQLQAAEVDIQCANCGSTTEIGSAEKIFNQVLDQILDSAPAEMVRGYELAMMARIKAELEEKEEAAKQEAQAAEAEQRAAEAAAQAPSAARLSFSPFRPPAVAHRSYSNLSPFGQPQQSHLQQRAGTPTRGYSYPTPAAAVSLG